MLKLEEILKPAIDKPQKPPEKNPAGTRPRTRKPAATTRNGIRTPKNPRRTCTEPHRSGDPPTTTAPVRHRAAACRESTTEG